MTKISCLRDSPNLSARIYEHTPVAVLQTELGEPQSALVQQLAAGMHLPPHVLEPAAQEKVQACVVVLQVAVVLAAPPVQSLLVQQLACEIQLAPQALNPELQA